MKRTGGAVFFIFYFAALYSQDLALVYRKGEFKLSRHVTRDPRLLAEALTFNRESEKEKFDAIFGWVSENIRYDYQKFASSSAEKKRIRKILKRRRAICVDYAIIMDTLCSLAGINNVSLGGYARDYISDVGDSLYTDNHAWNAVKLEGKWYVYDVTWSTGTLKFGLTKFSRIISYLADKTVKRRKVKVPVKRIYNRISCDESNEMVNEHYEYREVVVHPLFRKLLLSCFRIRYTTYYSYEPNTDYYLAEPEVFAITHIPVDPSWTLMRSRSLREFEEDSAFYHFDESILAHQKRNGRYCPECDNFLSLGQYEKEYEQYINTLHFNGRNRGAPAINAYHMGSIRFEESKPAEDSLTKITLLDTSLAWIALSRTSLIKASALADEDYQLQKTKNRKKLYELVDDNHAHSRFIRQKARITFNETRNIRDLEHKSVVAASYYLRREKNINELRRGNEIRQDAKKVPATIQQLSRELDSKTTRRDSLNRQIARIREDFNLIASGLSKKLWARVYNHDSLLVPLRNSIGLRAEMMDNYKKAVVMNRDNIKRFENNYARELDSTIYRPAAVCYDKGDSLFSLIKERNDVNLECYHLKGRLVKMGSYLPGKLDSARLALLEENKADFCWVKGNSGALATIVLGFRELMTKQKSYDRMLFYENDLEVVRYRYINKDLYSRRQRYKRITWWNKKIITKKYAEVKKEKSKFLKKLRAERKKK